tara:strand:- start:122 stop:547 length:426 start_codon:yes stop_codon:yes gene_type:complete
MSASQEGQLQNYSVDQLGGFVVMVAGAIGSLLLVVWQSKCHCKMNLCYIFQCERRPPSEEEMKGLQDQFKKSQKKEDEILDKEGEILDKEDEILEKGQSKDMPKEKIIIDEDESLIPKEGDARVDRVEKPSKKDIIDLDEP